MPALGLLTPLPHIIGTTVTNVDLSHAKNHEGLHFVVTDIDTSVDIATPKIYRILSPTFDSSAIAHLIFQIETEPGALVEFFEAPTVTVAGTGLSEINMNRNSPNVAETSITSDPTVTANGTLLFSKRSGTTTLGGKVGLELSHVNEFILDTTPSSTVYQLRITPLVDATVVSVLFDWYEVIGPLFG